MAFRVVRRPDQLLQRNNSRGHEGLEDTFIGMYTVPAHQALERFVDERLANRTFETRDEVSQVLKEWQSFYYGMHKRAPHRDWRDLYLDSEGHMMASTGGMNGDFVFAVLEEVEAPVTAQ